MKRKFTKQELLDILWGEDEDSKIVLDEITDNTRWRILRRFVFKKGGQLYETDYAVGATEQQCEGPWEYEDTVECVEVESYERVIVDYRPLQEELDQEETEEA